MADLGEGISLLLDATLDLNAASENLQGAGDKFKIVDLELEGMASWVGMAADAWDRMAVALKIVESGVNAVAAGFAELMRIAAAGIGTEGLQDYWDNVAQGFSENAVEAWDAAKAMAEDRLVDPKSQRMLREKAERDLRRRRKQNAEESAGGVAPAVAFAPKLTTQAGASGILRGQDASTVTLESQQGKLDTFLKEWLTEDSRKKLADGVAAAAVKGFAKAVGGDGAAAFSGPLEAQMSKARRIFEQTRSPLEKFNTKIEELKTLLDVGAFAGMGGEETYRRAVEQAREAHEKAIGAADTPKIPGLARIGSQEAYELVRQNRMGDGGKVAPMVQEQKESNRSLASIDEGIRDMVEEMREQTEALQGTDLDL
jgi:hypothetical protein